MITVAILVNGKPIYTRSAVNVTKGRGKLMHQYKLDDGKLLKHTRSMGAIPLAIAMLKTIKEL